MLLVWHTIGQKSRGSGHLVECHETSVNWLVVRVFYCVADFTMLNTVNLGRFVTLTFGNFVTPQQVRHRLVVNSECDVVEFNLRSHSQSIALYAAASLETYETTRMYVLPILPVIDCILEMLPCVSS